MGNFPFQFANGELPHYHFRSFWTTIHLKYFTYDVNGQTFEWRKRRTWLTEYRYVPVRPNSERLHIQIRRKVHRKFSFSPFAYYRTIKIKQLGRQLGRGTSRSAQVRHLLFISSGHLQFSWLSSPLVPRVNYRSILKNGAFMHTLNPQKV